MTWTGITKERTYVQQTGHRVPSVPFRDKDKELVLWDPAQAGMAWLCSMGTLMVLGNELAGPNYLQLNFSSGKRSGFSPFN